MIYEIAREVATAMASRGFPFRVEYGPPRVAGIASPGAGGRIIIMRDRETPDAFEASRGLTRGGGSGTWPTGNRLQACVARVEMRSTAAGAGIHDHERLCESAVDMLWTALADALRGRNNELRIAGGRYLDQAALQALGLEQWPGVVYELRFSVSRGVEARTFEGDAPMETATIGTESPDVILGLTTHVLANADDVTPEVIPAA